jgi:hypothetical protein
VRRALLVLALALTASLATAQEPLTKQQVIDRSAGICRDLVDDTVKHVRGMRRADGPNGVVRHGRRFVRDSRPHVRELRDLPEPSGAVMYRRFVNNTDEALDWLAKALNALEARRGGLAKRRADTSGEHAARAKRAARRYGLRRSCIRYVS